MQPVILGAILAHGVAAHDQDFAPLQTYLRQFRLGQLPRLDVSYANGTAGNVVLRGALTYLWTEEPLLQRPPRVTWPAASGKSFTLAFIDFGPDTGGEKTQSPFFPFVHSLWTGCTSSLADCSLTVKPYLAPGNPYLKPNRYTYMLFRHQGTGDELRFVGGLAKRFASPGASRKLQVAARGFSISRLLEENKGLEAAAVTFAMVRGHKIAPSDRRGRRRGRN